MDLRFIKSISEAYILDKDLKKFDPNCNPDQISSHIYDLVKDLRENDLELYDALYDRSKVTQQKIIYRYLDEVFSTSDNSEEEVLTEDFMMAGGVMLMLAAIKFRQPLNKAIFGSVATLGKFFDFMGRKISRMGRYWKFRYSIIQENAQQCYQKCGVNPDTLSSTSYFTVNDSFLSNLASTEGHEQGACLAECYMDSLIESISLYMKSYFICLKNTGADISLKGRDQSGGRSSGRDQIDPDEIMKLLSKTNLSGHCKPFYDQAKDAFDNFQKVIDFIYSEKQDKEKQRKIDALRSRLYQAKQEIEGQRDFSKYR